MKSLAIGVVLLGISASAAATGGSPLDPAAQTVPFSYTSAFGRYVAFREIAPEPWRELNETVGRIGGHAGSLSTVDESTKSGGNGDPRRSQDAHDGSGLQSKSQLK